MNIPAGYLSPTRHNTFPFSRKPITSETGIPGQLKISYKIAPSRGTWKEIGQYVFTLLQRPLELYDL
jgi:hypothetical protein